MKKVFAILSVVAFVFRVLLDFSLGTFEGVYVITSIILAPFLILIFTLSENRLQKREGGKVAAFLSIQSGSASISCGFPALIYIVYTWIRRNDGKEFRGREFSGARSPYIAINALIGIASLFVSLYSTDLQSGLTVFSIAIAVIGAIKTENDRHHNLSL